MTKYEDKDRLFQSISIDNVIKMQNLMMKHKKHAEMA